MAKSSCRKDEGIHAAEPEELWRPPGGGMTFAEPALPQSDLVSQDEVTFASSECGFPRG